MLCCPAHPSDVLLGACLLILGAQPVHVVEGERFLGPIGSSTVSEQLELPPRFSRTWAIDVQGGYALVGLGRGAQREGIMGAFFGLRLERQLSRFIELWMGPGLLMGEAFVASGEPGETRPPSASYFGSVSMDLGADFRIPMTERLGLFLSGGPHLRWAFTLANEGIGVGFQAATGLEFGQPGGIRWAGFVEGRHSELGDIDPTSLGFGVSLDFPLLH